MGSCFVGGLYWCEHVYKDSELWIQRPEQDQPVPEAIAGLWARGLGQDPSIQIRVVLVEAL